MKRLYIFLIVLLTLSFVSNAYAAEDHISYKSATEYDYPPFSVTNNGEADGFSVELLKAVAETMGLDITFKIDSWAMIKDELKNGELDVLPLVGYTKERDQHFDFTVPYIIMHGNIFIRNDNNEIQTEDDLYGKQIIVMKGDNAHEYAVKRGFSDELILTDTYEEAFKLLASGKYDAVLAQSLVGEQLIEQLGLKNIKAATQIDENSLTEIRTNLSGFEQKFCFAVKEGNKDLLSKLNEGLAIVSANGEFDRLYKKWFPFVIENKPDLIEVMKASFIIIGPILLVGFIIMILYTRYKIKKKTEELQRSNKAVLEMEAYLRTQQKLESIGVLASGVAHEINNPINGILNYSQVILDIALKEDADCNAYRDSVMNYTNEIINESNRISLIVTNLLQFSRKNKQFVECNIKELINGTLGLVTAIIKRDQIIIDIKTDPELPNIKCREQEIRQVLLNLILNAKDALNAKYEGYHQDKKITLYATETKLKNNASGIRITIEDNGSGIPKEIQNSIFDPFFTTKNRSEGTGLGLSISYGIIKDHNGMLSFETKAGKYTRFYIDLPLEP